VMVFLASIFFFLVDSGIQAAVKLILSLGA
jgi:preprotein translocase subunit SecE